MGVSVIEVGWRTLDVSIQHMHFSPDLSPSAVLKEGREICARQSQA